MAIDINIPSQVAQTITNGVTGTAPSQDVVFDALALKENTANKGIANGYVPLNASTKVDSSYLPSYVDDVIEVANYAALPVTGESGKIYITIDTSLLYRWGGTVYVQVGGQDPVWGGIVGTLSNQTDLQNALALKVPYTGAISDVNLGEFGLLTGNLEFDTTPTNIPTTAGSMVWNDTDGTIDLKLKGGNVTLQIGQEQVLRAVNKTATNITLLEANYQAVRVTGAQGQRLKVDLALATNDLLSAETIGLVTETIANNQEGFITTSGLVRGVNTTGSLQSETWVDGDILYLSPTTAGNITNIKPVAPNHLIIIGYVVNAHITQGTIFVKVDNGYELNELHNVLINGSLANNDALIYESSTQLWKNKTIPTAIGYTPANAIISISTTSPLSGGGDLSANRTLSISDAAADGTTKGAATFTASDFNATSGVVSIDYANGQAADGTNKGFLTATDWSTFNGKADINPRVQTVTSAATVTPTSLNDLVVITAQAAGLTIANPTGTMVQGQALMIRIKDNATARTIAFGANYRAIGITLPTTTVISKTLYLGCIWNSTDTKFDVIGLNQEA